MERKAFLDQEPPPGYIPGVGRGATGFTTSADTRVSTIEVEEDEDADETNIQDFISTDGSILAQIDHIDKEDEEADKIYEEIERKLNSKSKSNKSIPLQLTTIPATEERFSDLKRALTTVSTIEWSNLPEAGDMTRRNKRSRIAEQEQQRTYAVPDSALMSMSAGTISGLSKTNFQSISQSRDKLLGNQLDNLLSDNININNSTVNNEELDKIKSGNYANIKNVSKGRAILASLRKTEPHRASSWIASARLEEEANNLNQAKILIVEGCKNARKDEDIWIESIRLHRKKVEDSKLCKSIIAEGLRYNPKSEKLWLLAEEVENEHDIISRRRILMKGLEELPSNVQLWRHLILLEDDKEDVKKMLEKAVELCPTHWEFWENWINISPYEEAKVKLNRARKELKGDYRVWLTAAKLEEKGNPKADLSKLIKMMDRAFKDNLAGDSTNILTKTDWIQQAVSAELEGFSKTCKSIVTTLLVNENIQQDDLQFWLDEAEKIKSDESNLTSKYIYEFIIDKFPNNIQIWIKLLASLKSLSHNNLDEVYTFYEKAIDLNPHVEILVLMYAKDKWISGKDIDGAKLILKNLPDNLNGNINIVLARVKLEVKTKDYKCAQIIQEQYLNEYPESSVDMWYKYIHFLRFLNWKNNENNSIKLIKEVNRALSYFPESDKLYIQKVEIYLNELCDLNLARESASLGTKRCPESIDLWILLSKIDEKLNILIRARSDLDNGILKIPTSDKLWKAKIDLEIRNKDLIVARQLSNKALKLFPKSSNLWIQYLSLIPKMSQRKTAFLDALKSTMNSSIILMAIGVFFWMDEKHLKAESWFERSLKESKTNGDCWGWLYNFTKKVGTNDDIEKFKIRFLDSFDDIEDGETWLSVTNDFTNYDKEPFEILQQVSDSLLSYQII
ncbi:Pre-mRNA splicing factor prp1 [Scheffersomyces amazonensis]|uniref:Pre-mRNA splicing factor prp1 n=1 Tax=Scheffersomyces amazonensis TaxID=1078765 RepID=UPI00315D24A0